MQGNIWQNLSGYDVINYRGVGETSDHNLLYRAKSVADIITDGENDEHTDINQKFAVESVYEFVCDLGSAGGWCKDTVNKDGISLAIAINSGAAINNYQTAYTWLNNNNTTNVRKRKNAGLFGGNAFDSPAVLRTCFTLNDITFARPTFGGRFRCSLNS